MTDPLAPPDAPETTPTCPRCLASADHSPDEKQCSDNCIVRYQKQIAALLAAHAREVSGLTLSRDIWKKGGEWAEGEIDRLKAELAAAEARATTAERERDEAERRLLWAQGSADRLAELSRALRNYAECDLHVHGPGPSGGYKGRVDVAREALDLVISLLADRDRLRDENARLTTIVSAVQARVDVNKSNAPTAIQAVLERIDSIHDEAVSDTLDRVREAVKTCVVPKRKGYVTPETEAGDDGYFRAIEDALGMVESLRPASPPAEPPAPEPDK